MWRILLWEGLRGVLCSLVFAISDLESEADCIAKTRASERIMATLNLNQLSSEEIVKVSAPPTLHSYATC